MSGWYSPSKQRRISCRFSPCELRIAPNFISSLENKVEKLAGAIRGHWSIENSLHWVLDVTFQEDNNRMRKDNAPANFAVLRHIAVNIIGQNKNRKLSVKKKRFLASLDEEYSRELLEAILA
jgi:hypothetical protein